MTSKVNQRAKRKNEFFDVKSEPNMKALKKEDIIARFSALHTNYKILENKNLDLENKKQTNPLTNKKQTNKYTFLYPTYLSQIKLDLPKIFRVYSCACPKMIKKKTSQ